MGIVQVTKNVFMIPLGIVNAYVIDTNGSLALIDSGVPGSAPAILTAIEQMGKRPADVKQILLTHLHGDHTGSASVLKEATGAPIYMHPVDAAAFEQGQVSRPVKPAPGLVNRLIAAMMVSRPNRMNVQPAKVDQSLNDGDVLDFAGGLQVIHAPGHAAGQVVFLVPQEGGVLIAADVCSNLLGLGYSPIYEDLDEGRRTLKKLSQLRFETAVFGHGKPLHGADAKFRKKWGNV